MKKFLQVLVIVVLLFTALVPVNVANAAGKLPPDIPRINELRPILEEFVRNLQGYFSKHGVICTPGRWYPTRGTTYFRVFYPDACAWPTGIFIDSTEYFTHQRIHLKVLFAPTVVQGYKMGGVKIPNVDGWTDTPTPGWKVMYSEFEKTPTLLIADLTILPELMALWQSAIQSQGAHLSADKLKELLGNTGFDPAGVPLAASMAGLSYGYHGDAVLPLSDGELKTYYVELKVTDDALAIQNGMLLQTPEDWEPFNHSVYNDRLIVYDGVDTEGVLPSFGIVKFSPGVLLSVAMGVVLILLLIVATGKRSRLA